MAPDALALARRWRHPQTTARPTSCAPRPRFNRFIDDSWATRRQMRLVEV